MNPNRKDVDALLNEAPWLRRIARSLLRDEANAEDLSQEVLAAALTKPPGLAGDSLRGWLATVMKRMANRTREREHGRERAEQQAAQPEAIETETGVRLDLHKRLSEAVEAIEEPYRTALVLRYFNELAPREIAVRLGITPVAARKRVSRGLALLRAQLDREFDGGRKAWSVALLGVLAHRPKPPAPPTQSVTNSALKPYLFAVMKLKTLAVIAGIGITLGFFWYKAPTTLSTPPNDGLDRAVELAGLERETTEFTPTPKSVEARRESVPIAKTPEVVSVPRLRVVDEQGLPVSEARAAWIDMESHVRTISIDAVLRDVAHRVRTSTTRPLGSKLKPRTKRFWLERTTRSRVDARKVGFLV